MSVLLSVALSSSSVPCGAEVMLLFAGKVIATRDHRAKTILVYFKYHEARVQRSAMQWLLCDCVIICIFGDKLTQIGNWGIVQHIAFISQIYHHSYHKPTPLHDVTRKHNKYYFAIVSTAKYFADHGHGLIFEAPVARWQG